MKTDIPDIRKRKTVNEGCSAPEGRCSTDSRRMPAIQKRHGDVRLILLAIFPSKGYYHTHIFCWENVAFARFHALPWKRTADFLY